MGTLLIVIAAGWLVLAAEAQADIVHLKNGRSHWGTEVLVEGDTVVLVRPGGNLRFPKAQVDKIEPVRSSLPPHYSVPTAPPAAGAGPLPGAGIPGAVPPGAPPAAPPAGAPAPPGGATPTAPAPSAPPAGGATQLPPPPAPPAPGGAVTR
jgi:hypothetical protein